MQQPLGGAFLLQIDQQPPGKRRSFVTSRTKDYRLRLSLRLYLTAPNLQCCRLAAHRRTGGFLPVGLSGRSRHRPALRSRLLVQSRGPACCSTSWGWFARTGALRIHAQVVVCPGLNDGEALLGAAQGSGRLAAEALAAVLCAASGAEVGRPVFRARSEFRLCRVDAACAAWPSLS